MEQLRKEVKTMKIENHVIVILVFIVTGLLAWVGSTLSSVDKRADVLNVQIEELNKNLTRVIAQTDIMYTIVLRNQERINFIEKRLDTIERSNK